MGNDICKNCNTELDQEILINGRYKLLEVFSNPKIDLINKVLNLNNEMYCSNCGSKFFEKAIESIEEESKRLVDFISGNIDVIPIITINNPLNWNYEVIGIVTGQSTIGTGVITEFTSSYTDFFGLESGAHNAKLKKGEQQCFLQLRMETLNLGGNAIISSDVDYAEIGSLKGILMVCATGTAIRLTNSNELNLVNSDILEQVYKANSRLKELVELKRNVI